MYREVVIDDDAALALPRDGYQWAVIQAVATAANKLGFEQRPVKSIEFWHNPAERNLHVKLLAY